ncbi:MAG TPA: response regulator transcription factor [Sphingomicrobium sp.]|jgi:DNA-binding NarL/FixJ family response regulator|nr:response regulator transcription factor [Sphingomicrobium sp.]
MNILIVDDHAIVRAGLRRLLKGLFDGDVLEAATGREALALARGRSLDLVLLDMNLPELGGLELLSRLATVAPNLPVLVLSMHAEPLYVTRAMEAGARGYVSKNVAPEELVTAIKQVAAGGRYVEGELAQSLVLNPAPAIEPLEQLTPRDLEIIRLLARGRSLSEIADALGLGYKTIANTCTQIKAKLGVNRTADLVRVALEAGIC